MTEDTKDTKKTNEEPEELTASQPTSAQSDESMNTTLESRVADLKEQLQAKETEAKENYDRLLRQAAELDNFKKRVARERDDAVRFANENLVKDLLPVVDNLERAIAHASGGGNGKPLVEGVEMVLRGLLDVLSKHGVNQISAQGQSFDPAKHESIAQVESKDHSPNSVVEEHHKGYMLHDRLLRPALVSVAKAAETREKKNQDHKVENGSSDD